MSRGYDSDRNRRSSGSAGFGANGVTFSATEITAFQPNNRPLLAPIVVAIVAFAALATLSLTHRAHPAGSAPTPLTTGSIVKELPSFVTKNLGAIRETEVSAYGDTIQPEYLTEPMILKNERNSVTVAVTMLDAPFAKRVSYSNGVRYASSQYDVVRHLGNQPHTLVQKTVVWQHQGLKTWKWKLDSSSGKPAKVLSNGTVLFDNGASFRPPVLMDTAGKPLQQLTWNLNGSVLSTTVDDRALAVPYVIDPADATAPYIYLYDYTTLNDAYWPATISTAPQANYNKIFVKTDTAGTLTARYSSCDPDTQTNYVTFPDVDGAGTDWSPPGQNVVHASASPNTNCGATFEANYYNADDFTNLASSDVAVTDMQHDQAGPPGGLTDDDVWSFEYTGTLYAPSTGAYDFQLTSKRYGARMYVDGQLVVDDWTSHSTSVVQQSSDAVSSGAGGCACTPNLVAGRSYKFLVQFYRNVSNASNWGDDVEWDLPGGGTTYVDIPTTSMGTRQLYSSAYSWTGGSADPGSLNVTATNNGTTPATSTAAPMNIVRDISAPVSGSISYTNTWVTGPNDHTITVVDGNDGTGSGMNSIAYSWAWSIDRREAPTQVYDGSTGCGTFGSWASLATYQTNGPGTYNDLALNSNTCYEWRWRARDNLNQTTTYTNANQYKIDVTAPAISSPVFTPVTGSTYQYDAGSGVNFVNTTQAGSFTVGVTASDVGSGLSGVSFPALGIAPWDPIAAQNDVSSPYVTPTAYSWTAGAADPGVKVITATDNVAQTNTLNIDIRSDTTAPTSGSITVPDQYQIPTSVDISKTDPSDGVGAGFTAASTSYDRRDATMTNGTCGAYGSWGQITTNPPAGNYTDATLVDGLCYQYRYVVPDRVSNTATITSTNQVKVDATDPTGTISGTPVGPSRGIIDITGTSSDPAAAGGGYSGVKQVKLEYDNGAARTTICNNPATPTAYTCSWDTSARPNDTYTITLTVTDWALNTSEITRSIVLDNGDPTGSVNDWAPVTGPLYQYDVGSTLYYNPAQSGQTTLKITASDVGTGGSGIYGVDFPDVNGANWTPIGTTSVTTGPSPYPLTYSWSPTGSNAAGLVATVYDGATDGSGVRNHLDVAFTMTADSIAPATGSLTVPNQFQNATNVSITWANGTDGGSGIRGGQLQRDTGTLAAGACAGYTGTFTNIGGATASPYNNTGLADGSCYKYREVTTDNVDNSVNYNSGNEVKVDLTIPTNSISATPAGPSRGTVGLSGTATDGASGVQKVDVTYIAPSPETGTICTNQPAAWSCNWITNALLDGEYTIQSVATDYAGNTKTVTRTLILDNQGPVVSFNSYVATAGGTKQYAVPASSIMYYNSASTGAVNVKFNVTDAGTGVSTVAYPDLDGAAALWTPGAGNSATGSSPYGYVYTWASSAVEPNLKTITATDFSGNATNANFTILDDIAAPAGGSITVPDIYQNITSQSLVLVSGADGLSGVRDWQVQRNTGVLANGTCSTYAGWVDVGNLSQVSPLSQIGLADSACYKWRMTVWDKVDNSVLYSPASEVKVDTTLPVTVVDAAPAGPSTGTISIAGTATDGGSSVGLNSGTGHVDVTWDGPGPTNGVICNAPTITAGNWSCNWNTSARPDGTYTITSTVTDNAGNVNTDDRTIVLDNNAPVSSFNSFEATGGAAYQYASGSTLYFNNAAGGSVKVKINASDAGVGVQKVSFPDLDGAGTAWTPAGGDDTVGPTPYNFTYTWAVAATSPGGKNATAYDNSGNNVNVPFTMTLDTISPAGGGLTVSNARHTATTTDVTAISNGNDGGAGLLVSTGQLERRMGTYSQDGCSAYAAWGNIGGTNPGASYTDNTIINGKCYQYRYNIADRVSNATVYTNANEVKVDTPTTGAPTGSISANPVGPIKGTQAISGTATDLESDVQKVDLDFSGPAGGTVCNAPTLTANGGSWDWSCNWNTTPGGVPLAEGTYLLTLTITDKAGNTSTATRNIVVDNIAPATSFNGWTEVTNNQYMWSSGSTMYFNPDQSGSFTVNINATDATGISSVAFPDLDGGGAGEWTPAGGNSGTGSSPYGFTYAWVATATSPGAMLATSTDNATNSATAGFTILEDNGDPSGGSISYSNAWSNAAPPLTVNIAKGTDALTGVPTWQVQRKVGTLNAGTCSGYTAFADFGSANPAGASVTDATIASGNCYMYQLVVTDGVGNQTTYTSASEYKYDTVIPTGSINATPASPFRGTVAIAGTATDVTSAVGVPPAGGTGFLDITYSGAGAGTICSSPAPIASWSCNWVTSSTVDGAYTINLAITDNAGNVRNVTRNVVIDNVAPATSFDSYVEVSGGQYLSATASNMFYNSAGTGSFTLKMNATDGGSGMDKVEFPDLDGAGTLWTPSGTGINNTPPSPYAYTYVFAAGAVSPGAKTTTAYDLSGNTSTAGFTVTEDITAPTGETISYPTGRTNVASVTINSSSGSDAGAGIGTQVLQRRTATYSGDSCGSYGAWIDFATNPTQPNHVDNTIADDTCYQYQLLVNDLVSNQSLIGSANEVKVDLTDPTGTISGVPAGPAGGSVVFTGTASDAASSVASVTLAYSGPAAGAITLSGTTAWTSDPWVTNALADGTYTITATITDNAGNSGTTDRTIVIDNNGPVMSFNSFLPGTSAAYQFVSGSTLYFNNAVSGSTTVKINATDAPTGVNYLTFPDLDGAGTDWTPSSGNVNGATPYSYNYTWAIGSPTVGPKTVTGYDNAAPANTNTAGFTITLDNTAPGSGSVTYANQRTNAASVGITYAEGSDAGAGLATWKLQRSQGSYGADACSAYGAWTDVATGGNAYTDLALTDGKCYKYRLVVDDNVSNQSIFTSANEVKVDRINPAGTVDAIPASPASGDLVITGTASDGYSDVGQVAPAKVDVAYSGPAAGVVCTGASQVADGASWDWACPAWATASLADGTYTITATIIDRTGNSNTATRNIVIDNNGPVTSFSSFATGSNPQYQYVPAAGSTMYYNSLYSGSLTVNIAASDAGTGVSSVAFPDLDGGAASLWTPAGGNSASPSSPYAFTYTWATGAVSPGLKLATASDALSNTGTASFTIVDDSAPPSGGSISYTPAILNGSAVTVNFTNGTDGASGIANRQIQRRSATYSNATCGSWGSWTNTGGSNPGGVSINETGLADGTCFQWQYVVTDRVGNVVSYTSPDIVSTDSTAPSGTVDTTPTSPASGLLNITGTYADTFSGVGDVDVAYTGPSSGTVCNNASLVAGNWSCPAWDTTAPLLADGSYTITATFTDNSTAANTATADRVMVIDNNAPATSFNSYVYGTNPQYQFKSGSTMYFNPAQSGSFTLKMNATDAGTGMKHVVFPDVDGAGIEWSPSGGATNNTPPSPYGQLYSWTSGAASPGLKSTTAEDNAGNTANATFTITADASDPSGGSISYPNMLTTGTTVTITFAEGTDTGSGLATWQLQRAVAALTSGTCGGYGAWANIGGVSELGPTYDDTTLADGNCYKYQLVSTDKVGNNAEYTTGSVVKVDNVDPTGSVDPTPASPFSGTVAVAGTAADTYSGVGAPGYVAVTYSGAASGGVAGCANLAVTAGTWTCNWNTLTPVIPDGNYTITATVHDAADNTATATRNVVVDNNAPTISFNSWVAGTNPSYQFGSGSTMYYNPAVTGSFTVKMTAADAGTGIESVEFPDLDGGGASLWTPAGGDSPASVTPYDFTYTWAIGAANPLAQNAIAHDFAGNQTNGAFTIEQDSTAPLGGSIGYSNVTTNTGTVDVTFTNGGDGAGSGLGTKLMQRASATLTNGTCGGYGSWSTIATNPGASPVTDATIADGNCYKYQYVVNDKVSNQGIYSSANVVKADTTNPTGTISSNPVGPATGLLSISGTSTDAGSGVGSGGTGHVDVTYTGPSAGTICNSPPTPATWSCNWDTANPLLADGSYTITLTVTDNAGNTGTAGRNIVLDNNGPVATFNSFVTGTGGEYQFASGSTMYYNPAGAGSFDVLINATDAGSGMASVDFPDLDGGAATDWTPAGGQNTTGPTPYDFTYTWASGAANPGPQNAAAVDVTSNTTNVGFTITADSTSPTGGSISYSNAITAAASVLVSFTGSNDTGSGVSGATIQRRAAAYSGGNCAAFGSWGTLTTSALNPPANYTDATIADGFCYQYQLLVNDKVSNTATYTSANAVKVDRNNPTGTISAVPAGPSSAIVALSGTSADGGSGVATVSLAYSGPAAGAITTSGTTSWTANWDTTPAGVPIPDGTYTLTLTITDNIGNTGTATRNIVIDNNDPATSFSSYTQGTNPNYQEPVGSTMYYNPAGSGSFTLNIAATDVGGSGIDNVTYPDLDGAGALWTPAGGVNNTGPSPYGFVYNWSATAVSPGAQVTVAEDVAGNTANAGFTITEDITAPAGGSIGYANGVTNGASVALTLVLGADAQAGIGTSQLQRKTATFSGGVCSSWSAWSDFAAPNPPLATSDGTIADGTCYQYQLLVNDKVDNQVAYTNANVVKVDTTAPTGSISGTPASPISGTVNITGTSSDVASGVDSGTGHVDVDFVGPTTASLCASCGPTPSAWSQSWNTTLVGDGSYTLTATMYDNAGNSSTTQRVLVVDNNAPTASFASYTAGTNPTYQYASGSTMWFNPTVTGSVTVRVNATDAGSGIDNVAFPDLDGAATDWTPGAGDSATGSSPWAYVYTWAIGATSPGLTQTSAFDLAGNQTDVNFTITSDTTAPTGGTVTYPNGPTSGASVDVVTAAGSDAASGVGTVAVQRSTGTYSGDSCSAYGAFATVAAAVGTYTDSALTDGFCYKYRLLVNDRVQNQATFTNVNEVKVDRTNPTGAISGTPASPAGGDFNVTGTSTDAASTVDHIDITWDGPSATSGTICNSPPSPTNYSCNWPTSSAGAGGTPLGDGSYTITLTITDKAGNVGTATRVLVLDNNGPVTTFNSFVETSGGAYLKSA